MTAPTTPAGMPELPESDMPWYQCGDEDHFAESTLIAYGLACYEAGRSQAAADAQDAARYRWLCELHEWPEPVCAALDCGPKVLIDEAIDAAMLAARQEPT